MLQPKPTQLKPRRPITDQPVARTADDLRGMARAKAKSAAGQKVRAKHVKFFHCVTYELKRLRELRRRIIRR